MSNLLWRRGQTSPLHEDVNREMSIKDYLTQGLGQAVKVLQERHINSDEFVHSDDCSDHICNYIEAIFIHGLKDTFFEKVSAILSSKHDKPPQPNFWPFLLVFSHKDLISQINRLSRINTDIGRCRAWIRIALNDGLLESYLAVMVADKSSLEYYYKATAYLRDPEQPDIVRKYIEGLGVLQFKLACNSHMLNVWGLCSISFAGLWSYPVAPEPVVTGLDIASCLDDDGNTLTPGSKRKQKITTDTQQNPQNPEPAREIIFRPATLPRKVPSAEVTEESSSQSSCPDPPPPIPEDMLLHTQQNPEEQIQDIPKETAEDLIERIDTPETNLDLGAQDSLLEIGNSLLVKTGWSSSLDDTGCSSVSTTGTVTTPGDPESYKALLHSYNTLDGTVIRTPNFNQMFDSIAPETWRCQDRESQTSPEEKDIMQGMDFEIIPRSYFVTSEHADERTRALFAILVKLCPEMGLDSQNYQCKGCSRPIGMIYGKARVCAYDGCYYCHECHENEESIVPAKVIHNWDFRKYKVSKHTKIFLQQIEQEPLFNIHEQNPKLYQVVDEAAEIMALRTQLGYLRAYLFTCRESVAEDLRKRIWPREYLYEHIHLYSLADLQLISTGALAQFLKPVITFAAKHVQDCSLCSQKGFICEICKVPKVIFPFELDITYKCNRCLAVYHAVCMTSSQPCPKCDRILQRKTDGNYSQEVDEV